MTTPLWKADFHCHTSHSKDSLNSPQTLLVQARALGMSRLIITEYVIVGEEIMTTCGELLACFVSREVPRGLEPRRAIDLLRDQGAFISISHPFDYQRCGWKIPELLGIAPLVDAVEVFNSRCTAQTTNQRASRFSVEHHLAGTAGSDAHSIQELGRAYLELPPFTSAEELRQVVREARVVGNLSSPFIHFTSTWARMVKAYRQSKQNK
jgi:predicted metal-dependent phosphoesterase TrpH